MSAPTREEFDAKLDASEARSDAKFARIEGKLDLLVSKIDTGRSEASSNRNLLLGSIVTVALALAALLIAIVTYGDAIFSRGMQVRDVVGAVVKEQNAAKPASTP